jgi:hypothetical protein
LVEFVCQYVRLHPNTPDCFDRLTKISSRANSIACFGEAFVVDARRLQTSRSVFSIGFCAPRCSNGGTAGTADRSQWQMIKTLIPRVLSLAVQSAVGSCFDVR